MTLGIAGLISYPNCDGHLAFTRPLSLIGQDLRILLAMSWLFVPRANLAHATRVLLFNIHFPGRL
jgi:hypothetical protein